MLIQPLMPRLPGFWPLGAQPRTAVLAHEGMRVQLVRVLVSQKRSFFEAGQGALPVLVALADQRFVQPLDHRCSAQQIDQAPLRRPVEKAEERERGPLRPVRKGALIGGHDPLGMVPLPQIRFEKIDLVDAADIAVAKIPEIAGEQIEGEAMALHLAGRGLQLLRLALDLHHLQERAAGLVREMVERDHRRGVHSAGPGYPPPAPAW